MCDIRVYCMYAIQRERERERDNNRTYFTETMYIYAVENAAKWKPLLGINCFQMHI